MPILPEVPTKINSLPEMPSATERPRVVIPPSVIQFLREYRLTHQAQQATQEESAVNA